MFWPIEGDYWNVTLIPCCVRVKEIRNQVRPTGYRERHGTPEGKFSQANVEKAPLRLRRTTSINDKVRALLAQAGPGQPCLIPSLHSGKIVRG